MLRSKPHRETGEEEGGDPGQPVLGGAGKLAIGRHTGPPSRMLRRVGQAEAGLEMELVRFP